MAIVKPPKGSDQIITTFGDPVSDNAGFWREHMTFLHLHPDWAAVPTLRNKLGFWCNKAVHDSLKAVFEELRNKALIPMVKTFDGCYNLRMIRGGSRLSFHSFGAAVDINAQLFALGRDCRQPDDILPGYSQVVEAFEKAGWTWGGRWESRFDGMHFQYGAY